MDKLTEAMVSIATAIVGVAILAVLVSRNSNTSGVLSSAGGAFASMLGAATAPVTGASNSMNVGSFSMPNFGYQSGFNQF